MSQTSSSARALLRHPAFWLVACVLAVGVRFTTDYVVQLAESTNLPDGVDLDLERGEGPGPNGTYGLTDADLAALAPAVARALAEANATGKSHALLSAREMRDFFATVHWTEQAHDALTQSYQPPGPYIRYQGVAYRYGFTTL